LYKSVTLRYIITMKEVFMRKHLLTFYSLFLILAFFSCNKAQGQSTPRGSIYVAGGYRKNGTTIACVWKDGVMQELSIPSGARSSHAKSIAVSGSNVYVAGDYYNSSDIRSACIWVNGKHQNLSVPEGSEYSFANSIAIGR